MDDEDYEQREHHRNNDGGIVGGIIGLIVVIAVGLWAYNSFFGKDYSKPWWNGTAYQNVCVVHNPENDTCGSIAVTVEDDRITTLSTPDGVALIATMDCGRAETDGGLAGEGKRYCVIGDVGGKREWQVSQN